MESSLAKQTDGRQLLTVELGQADLAPFIERAEGALAQEVQIKGFRKGKAPKELARQAIDPIVVREEALDLAVRSSLASMIEDKQLDVLDARDLKVTTNNQEKLVYTVMLKSYPPVTIGELSNIKVSRRPVTVDEGEVARALTTIQDSRSSFTEKNGVVEKGDRLEIDFEVLENGMAIEGGVSKNHPLIVGEGRFIPGFEDNLTGLSKGSEKKFCLVAPADYFHKEIAGKNLDFTVTVQKIEQINKPTLDDNFARSIGEFSNLAALEASVREGILQEKNHQERERVRLECLTTLADSSKVEVPDFMVQDHLDRMVASFERDLGSKGLEMSLYLAHINKTQDDLRKDWTTQATKQVRLSLVLRAYAKENHINASPQEVEELANQRAQVQVIQGRKSEDVEVLQLRGEAEAEIINEKAFTLLEKTCVI